MLRGVTRRMPTLESHVSEMQLVSIGDREVVECRSRSWAEHVRSVHCLSELTTSRQVIRVHMCVDDVLDGHPMFTRDLETEPAFYDTEPVPALQQTA